MRKDRKKGLLLIDRLTLAQCCDYLHQFLQLGMSDLMIGIITKPTEHVSPMDRDVEMLCKLKIPSVIIPYSNSNSLLESVSNRVANLRELEVMLLSTAYFLVDEAEYLSWNAIKVPNQPGELARSHLVSFKKELDKRLLHRNPSTPLSLVISLDIDETVLFFEKSIQSGKILLNARVLDFLKNIIAEYEGRPLKIEMLAVTARSEKLDIRAHEEKNPFSVKRVMCEFSQAIQSSFRGKIPVHYTEEKYSKLCELYGSRTNTLVLHLDDNPVWTDTFANHPHIKYALVNSREYPQFMFSVDEKCLERWCTSYTSPMPVLKRVTQTSGFFHSTSTVRVDTRVAQSVTTRSSMS